MNISFFIGSLRRGGAERVISNLANYYASKGWNVDICLLIDTKIGYEINNKVRIVDLNVSSGNNAIKTLVWIKKIRQYVRSNKPDRIVSFVGRINMLVLAATAGLKSYVIVSERNDPKHDGRGKLTISICNLMYKTADKIVFQTKYEQSCFSSGIEKKSIIIPNPVSVDDTATRTNHHRVVTAGRLLPQKNHQMLINAIIKVKKVIPDIILDIYGEGMLRDKLTAQISDADASAYITLRGSVNDLHRRISDAAVFVMTSEFEGLSNALIEAMMMGLPCISTFYNGIDEVIVNGQNGIVLQTNSEDELAESIIEILSNEDKSDHFSTEAIKSSQRYKADTVYKMWENVIESH